MLIADHIFSELPLLFVLRLPVFSAPRSHSLDLLLDFLIMQSYLPFFLIFVVIFSPKGSFEFIELRVAAIFEDHFLLLLIDIG